MSYPLFLVLLGVPSKINQKDLSVINTKDIINFAKRDLQGILGSLNLTDSITDEVLST